MSADQQIRVIELDPAGLAANTDPGLLALVITRQEIESGSLGSVIERLHILTDSAENVERYGSSMIFIVTGYDHDPRELPQIPEVVAYFRALTASWPHWLWFLAPGVGAITLLFAMLCGCETRVDQAQRHTTYVTETEALKSVFIDLMNRGLPLFTTYAVDVQEVKRVFEAALSELGF